MEVIWPKQRAVKITALNRPVCDIGSKVGLGPPYYLASSVMIASVMLDSVMLDSVMLDSVMIAAAIITAVTNPTGGKSESEARAIAIGTAVHDARIGSVIVIIAGWHLGYCVCGR